MLLLRLHDIGLNEAQVGNFLSGLHHIGEGDCTLA